MRALTIKWKIEGDLVKQLEAEKEKILTALPNALNRLREEGIPEAARRITGRYNINKAVVLSAFTVSSKVTMHRLFVTFLARGRRFNLLDFHPIQTATGIVVEFIRGEREFYPHAFLQTMPEGAVGQFNEHKGVFFRRKLGPRGKIRPRGKGQIYQRLPIKAITKNSVPQMFLAGDISYPFREWTRNRLNELVKEELNSK